MVLPNAENAVFDRRKLTEYALNPLHDQGGSDKAIAFQKALGITNNDEDVDFLIAEILKQIQTLKAIVKKTDAFGQRFQVDVIIEKNGKSSKVKTG